MKNIYRIQAYDSIMCGYFCIRFIDYMNEGYRGMNIGVTNQQAEMINLT